MPYPRRLGIAVTKDLTIPSAGGSADTSLTLADFDLGSKIEAIVRISVIRKGTEIKAYAPEGSINSTSDAVGLTLFAASGTTLASEVVVIGY